VRRTRRSRTVFETRSRWAERIRVVDWRRERRLIVAGDILSVLPLDGDWSRVEREYWWRALAAVRLPGRPTALLVGLGGGTQVHLLYRRARPRLVTVVERDPVMVRVALDWFGLDRLGPLELVCADAVDAARGLGRLGRRFDFVMEDAAYADSDPRSRPLTEALAPLVAPGGALVLNRHRRGDARSLAPVLRRRFARVRLVPVRAPVENVLLVCERPRRASAA
jgi:spermidine synthase